MLRYRRYRVFVLFAVITLFLIYEFSIRGGSDWDTSKYSPETIRKHLGLPPLRRKGSGDDGAPLAASPRDQKPIELDIAAQTKKEGTESLPSALEDIPQPKQDLPKEKPSTVKAAQPSLQAGQAQNTPAKDGAKAKAPGLGITRPEGVGSPRKSGGEGSLISLGNSELSSLPDPNGEGFQGTPAEERTSTVEHFAKPTEHYPVKSLVALPRGQPKKIPRIQFGFKGENVLGRPDEAKLKEVRAAMRHTWKGYKDKAWGRDELHPVGGDSNDRFNGWGATLVDSLDTLYIMGMHTEFEEAVSAVEKIDFTTSHGYNLPLFETTIRYLGGLLGAYDVSGSKYPVLLEKAEQLAAVLYGAFDTQNRMPTPYYLWQPQANINPQTSSSMIVLAEIGSLSMEFTRLAQLTKQDKYYDAIARITDALYEWQKNTTLPGLWPTTFDATACFEDGDSGQASPLKTVTPEQANRKKFGSDEADAEAKEKALRLAELTDSSKGTKKTPDGFAIPAHVEFSRIKDHEEKTEVPPGYVEIDRPKPVEFKVNKAGKGVPRRPGKSGDVKKENLAPPKKIPEAGDVLDDLEKAKPGQGKIQYADTDVADGNGRGTPNGNVGALSSKLRKRQLTPNLEPVGNAASNIQTPDDAPKAQHLATTLDSPHSSSLSEDNEDDDSRQGTDESTGSKEEAEVGEQNAPSGGTKTIDNVPLPVSGGHDSALNLPLAPPVEFIKPKECKARFRHPLAYGSTEYSLAAMADSTYEYLPKEHILLAGQVEQYREMYERALPAAEKNIIFRPMLPGDKDVLLAGKYIVRTPPADENGQGESSGELVAENTHLACFLGGMFGLGAKIFDRPADLETAKKLTEGCVWSYFSTKSGVMPEVATFLPCDSKTSCKWNETAWKYELDPNAEDRQAYYEELLAEQEKSRAEKAAKQASQQSQGTAPLDGAAYFPQIGQQTQGQAGAAVSQQADGSASDPQSQTDGALRVVPNGTPPQAIQPGTKEPKRNGNLGGKQSQQESQKHVQGAAQTNAQLGTGTKPASDNAALDKAASAAPPAVGGQILSQEEQPKTGASSAAASEKLRRREIGDSRQPAQVWQPPANDVTPGESEGDQDSEEKDDEDEENDAADDDQQGSSAGDGTTSTDITSSEDGDKSAQDESDQQREQAEADAQAAASEQIPIEPDRIEKPLTRDEWVQRRLDSEGLPVGYVSIVDRKYMLRPEAIESVFYMHRLTGEAHWREVGWRMFRSVTNTTRTELGYSTVGNVLVPGGKDQLYMDEMQSFWPAETLKYFYLLFAGSEEYSLDEWVFNTEAHPFRRPDAPLVKEEAAASPGGKGEVAPGGQAAVKGPAG